jgi:hypothetical protein
VRVLSEVPAALSRDAGSAFLQYDRALDAAARTGR